MKQGFDVEAFVKRVGERLVREFDDARHATSPSTVAATMETPVRDQLQQILPHGIAVGSGFVIDSYGGTSRQSDIVLYEREICPVFTVNNTPETTYYPCEGVIAVGEIKSMIDTKNLADAFEKAESVKQLKRHYTTHPLPAPDSGKTMYLERKYGAVTTPNVLNTESNTTSRSDPQRQILAFVLAGQSRLSAKTLCKQFCHLTQQHTSALSPSLLATLDGNMLHWTGLTKRHEQLITDDDPAHARLQVSQTGPLRTDPKWSAEGAPFLRHQSDADAFGTLLQWIIGFYQQGVTTETSAFGRYFRHTQGEANPARLFVPAQMDWLP